IKPLALTNKEVAAKYDCTVAKDRTVHVVGIYSGKLSAITPDAAAAIIANGTNVLAEKKPAAAPVKAEVAPPAPEKEKKEKPQ
ncbi:MAG TPA: hypothetical protein PL045_10660, partial [Chitinophagaceae bacterium]|nr:hypothetical protein [Chitinophagaceae bacterium]